ncbi:SIR2 family protein [Epibacterium ulvae]|uniref:SIR2 family protein n=1 Tax=Epibacterium ulvae TaxID=1156985 RepID=UPI001BFC44EA|nr:SIR2 family protein [Epibacterium ulvae]MBT8152979.1 SIR2 family protein [Epibacterium ulvae]
MSNEEYDLSMALQTAWDDNAVLSNEHKKLIHRCLPEEVLESDITMAPKEEEQLDKLQRVLAACDEIAKVEISGSVGWLNDTGRQFPDAIRRYIHRAATYFHQLNHSLPNEFVTALVESVKDTGSHIATLNYDALLYQSFIGSSLFGNRPSLIDGFQGSFSEENLVRYRPSEQGFYLHLHGSPLYYTSQAGDIKKTSLAGVNGLIGHSSTHLVLAPVQHKAAVISASPLLRNYWAKLGEAMTESDSLVLFGYGGNDIHLNNMIRHYFAGKTVEVVGRNKPEYADDGGFQAATEWNRRLGLSIVRFWVVNRMVDFNSWQWDPNTEAQTSNSSTNFAFS